MDRVSKEQRHYNMSQIHGSDTKPEIIVRKYLFQHGLRYRKNDKRLPGHPDIVLPKYKTVVFVNGCFWHGHNNCKYAKMPLTNSDFWRAKILSNQIRDKKIIILGFGREGASSYRFLRKHFPDMEIVAADRSENLKTAEYQNDPKLKFVLGEKYAEHLNDYDLILKTPGVNLNDINYFVQPQRIRITHFVAILPQTKRAGAGTTVGQVDVQVIVIFVQNIVHRDFFSLGAVRNIIYHNSANKAKVY